MNNIISKPEAIQVFRMCALKAALKLECLGMKRRGTQVSQIIREEFGLKTRNKKQLLEEFVALIESAKKEAVNG